MTRTELVAYVNRLLDSRADEPTVTGLMLVRLQRTREFSLAYGYAAGDDLGRAALATLQRCLRIQDEVYPIGNFEFVVLLPRLQDRNHAELAGGRVVRAFEAPLSIGTRMAPTSVAVGISVSPSHPGDAEALFRHAQLAYREALRSSERSVVYAAEHEPVLISYEALREAIAGNQLEVHLQPILDLRLDKVIGSESLARWQHAEHGVVPPDSFIPLAEETGLISDLTRWSVNASVRHLAAARQLDPDQGISINLSPRVFGERDIVVQLTSALKIWGVPASAVNLEVTETALMEDPVASLHLLETLREAGFGISIDDFGSGYSSLAYLKRFPATELKIDRSFVQDMQDDPRSVQLVQSIIDLGHRLNMHVLAEGVETALALDMLRDMGCDRAQGYHICRPQPVSDFLASLAPRPENA